MNRGRLIILAALAASWILAITFRLYDLQVRRHEDYSQRARRQQQRVVVLDPPRGTLFDARGRELAVSIEVRSVAADPSKMDDPEGAARALGELLGIDVKKLTKDFRSNREFTWVKRKLDMPLVEQVEALEFKGVFTLPESKRYYPMGELAAQVLGYVGTDNKGLAGLEYYYDKIIAGAPGRRMVVRDARFGTARHPIPGDRRRFGGAFDYHALQHAAHLAHGRRRDGQADDLPLTPNLGLPMAARSRDHIGLEQVATIGDGCEGVGELECGDRDTLAERNVGRREFGPALERAHDASTLTR